jgi:hypothetical protein
MLKNGITLLGLDEREVANFGIREGMQFLSISFRQAWADRLQTGAILSSNFESRPCAGTAGGGDPSCSVEKLTQVTMSLCSKGTQLKPLCCLLRSALARQVTNTSPTLSECMLQCDLR